MQHAGRRQHYEAESLGSVMSGGSVLHQESEWETCCQREICQVGEARPPSTHAAQCSAQPCNKLAGKGGAILHASIQEACLSLIEVRGSRMTKRRPLQSAILNRGARHHINIRILRPGSKAQYKRDSRNHGFEAIYV